MDGWINGHLFVFELSFRPKRPLPDLKIVCFVVVTTVKAESKHALQRMKYVQRPSHRTKISNALSQGICCPTGDSGRGPALGPDTLTSSQTLASTPAGVFEGSEQLHCKIDQVFEGSVIGCLSPLFTLPASAEG